MKKSYAVACIVFLLSVSIFCGLLMNNLEQAVDDKPEVETFEIESLENGELNAKSPTIKPIDNGRPY